MFQRKDITAGLGSRPHTWDFGRKVDWVDGTWRPRNLWEARVDTGLGCRSVWFSNTHPTAVWYLVGNPMGSVSVQWYLYCFLFFCHRVSIYTFFSHHLHNALLLLYLFHQLSHTRSFTNTDAAWPSFSATFSPQNALPFHLHLDSKEGLIMRPLKCTVDSSHFWS